MKTIEELHSERAELLDDLVNTIEKDAGVVVGSLDIKTKSIREQCTASLVNIALSVVLMKVREYITEKILAERSGREHETAV